MAAVTSALFFIGMRWVLQRDSNRPQISAALRLARPRTIRDAVAHAAAEPTAHEDHQRAGQEPRGQPVAGGMGRHQPADDVSPLRHRVGADVRAVASAGQAVAGAGKDCRRRAGHGDRARSRVRQCERVHRHGPAGVGDDAGGIWRRVRTATDGCAASAGGNHQPLPVRQYVPSPLFMASPPFPLNCAANRSALLASSVVSTPTATNSAPASR